MEYEATAQRCQSRATTAAADSERHCWSMTAQAWLTIGARIFGENRRSILNPTADCHQHFNLTGGLSSLRAI